MTVKRIAIIPARGGSKRIPGKNVREFFGQPMIAYILKAARQSALFDEIHVSTDSPEITATVERLGFPIAFGRPAELADDHTPIMPVLRYVTEKYLAEGRSFDEVWLLMACAPFIEPEDLTKAAQLFSAAQGRSVLAVASYPAPVEWAFERSSDGGLTPVQPGMFKYRSQDLAPKYYDTGSFAVFSAKRVLGSEGAGVDNDFHGHVLPHYKAIDIDTEDDWRWAELLFETRSKRGGR